MGPLTALAVLIVLAIAPAVTFLLFWEVLVSLRDDALIEDIRLGHDLDPTELTGFTALGTQPTSRETPSLARCPSCGVEALADHDACAVCGSQLE